MTITLEFVDADGEPVLPGHILAEAAEPDTAIFPLPPGAVSVAVHMVPSSWRPVTAPAC
jgi:hypothetical protein